MTVGLFVFELLDDFLFVALGALLYSYSRQWFGGRGDGRRRASQVVNGLAFGLLATALTAQGVPMSGGVIVDARNVPIALIALFDFWGEINNPLAVVLGALEMLRSKVPADGLEDRLLQRGLEAVDRIKDIVTRMTRITRVERLPGEDERLPALLDIRRSSESA